jgi:hypothetical protein
MATRKTPTATVQPAAKGPARTKAVKAVKAVSAVKPTKAPKAAKPVAASAHVESPGVVDTVAAPKPKPKAKLVRDSFTIPKSEYVLLDEIKQRATRLARPTKKGEILRAGIAVLHAMGDEALFAALNAVPSLKTGRPNRADPAPARDETGKA